MKKFRIKSDVLEEVGSKGKRVYKISSIQPNGIQVFDEADNGVEIVRTIKWADITK